MENEPKLVHAKNLPATLNGVPPPKRNDAEVRKFADFAKISVNRARQTMESKTGEIIRAVAEGMAPEFAAFVRSQVSPLQARVAELTNEVSQIRDEWQAVLSGTQKRVKTIKTRRGADGQLVADVFEGNGTPINKYVGVWNADTEYGEGDVATHDGSAFIAKKITRDKPGTSDSWQLMVKRGKDGKDAK